MLAFLFYNGLHKKYEMEDLKMIEKNGIIFRSLKGYLRSIPDGFMSLSMEVKING
jgi:hypothetical protein